MGSFWSKYGECGATTGLMLLSLFLAILGIAFIYTIIGIFAGLGLLIAAWIIFLISLIMLIKVIASRKWKEQSTFCKVNIFICVILLVLLIAFSAVGGVKHQNAPGPTPVASNEASTTPSAPSP